VKETIEEVKESSCLTTKNKGKKKTLKLNKKYEESVQQINTQTFQKKEVTIEEEVKEEEFIPLETKPKATFHNP